MPVLRKDRLGLYLRATVNELDLAEYVRRTRANRTDEDSEQFYIMHLGATRLVKLALEARPGFDVPTLTYRRDSRIARPVLQIVSGMGMIEHGRRVAQTAMAGTGEIEHVGSKEFMITLPAKLFDDQYYERSIAEHYTSAHTRMVEEALHGEAFSSAREEVDRLLDELVYPFKTHFIGYGGDPLLDEYFYALAFQRVALEDGYDTFNYAVEFGGVSFQKFILAITFLQSLSLRHERFAEALCAKDSKVRIENVLTISADPAAFVDTIREALSHFGAQLEEFGGITTEDAETIFRVLSVGRENTALLDRPGCSLPPLIRTSEGGVIRCQTGSLNRPVLFLLDSLRFHFPTDYDRNQARREQSMQAAMRRVLDELGQDFTYLENVKLRLGGRLITDVDLVAIDGASGQMILVQLKHQDPFGMDIATRESRSRRLKQQSQAWLTATSQWMAEVGDRGLRSAFRLEKTVPDPTIYRMIVARHFSYPLRGLPDQQDVAFGNWLQFYNAVELVRIRNEGTSLARVFDTLQASQEPGGRQEHHNEPPSEWVIDDLKFTIRQAS